MLPTIKPLGILALLGLGLTFAGGVRADTRQADPVNLLYAFQASGQFMGFDQETGKFTYVIDGEGRAPRVKGNGLVVSSQDVDDDDYKVTLSGAEITFDSFDPTMPPPIVKFSCKNCKLTFPDGSMLVSDEFVPLEGRALFLYGPVAPDPAKPILSIRMMGCSGLQEATGTGRLANKVGSICFNGEFNFDVSDPNNLPATLTGQSNCTIVMHTPKFY